MPKLTAVTCALLAGLLLAAPALADPPTGNAANERLDAKGERIEKRLDARGDRVDARLDKRGAHARENGHPLRARRLDAKGDRIDHRLDKRGERVAHRLDQRGDRIDARRGGSDD